MTPPQQPTDAMDRPAFERALSHLVAQARDEAVPIDGAYDVRSPRRDRPDYTVEISGLAKRRPDRSDRSDRTDERAGN